MKKAILCAAVGMLALASCKKDYTCTYENTVLGSETVINYNNLSKDEADELEDTCKDNFDGKWAVK